jgi:hypothetical protein
MNVSSVPLNPCTKTTVKVEVGLGITARASSVLESESDMAWLMSYGGVMGRRWLNEIILMAATGPKYT